jgi:hypothetical protein
MSSNSAVAMTRPGNGTINLVPKNEHDELTIIRQTYAKDLTDEEFGVLVADARHRGLDVVNREVVGIKFQGKMTPFVTLAGARKLAEMSGKLAGVEGPFFCGKDGHWCEVWLDEKTPPAAAKFIVHRNDSMKPIVGIATWHERAQTYFKDGKKHLMPTWASMPSTMLGKVAEMDAFRRARMIPDDLMTTAEAGEDAAERPPKVGAMRHLHGVAAKHGLTHDDARTVVQAVRPGTASMADPDVSAGDLSAAADVIEAFDDEAVIRLLDDPDQLAQPAEHVVAPDAEDVTWDDFRAYAKANGVNTGREFTDLTQRLLSDLTASEAKALLAEVLASMPTSDGDQL